MASSRPPETGARSRRRPVVGVAVAVLGVGVMARVLGAPLPESPAAQGLAPAAPRGGALAHCAGERVPPAPFTARHVARVLAASRRRGGAGFFYVWSPHMPLSVRGLPEAAAVAGALGLEFIAALDPYADGGLVQALLDAATVRPEDARRLTADAVLEQGVLLHFPSLLPFVDGRLLGPGWPGYHRPDVLERYLKRRLK